MGALPKRKYAKARQGKRREHLGISAPSLINCPQCGSPKLPHQVCRACGSYKGREVIEVKSSASKSS